jgi:hypothetical protein
VFLVPLLLLGDPTKDLHEVEPSPSWVRQALVFCDPSRTAEVVAHCERLGFTVVDLACPGVRDGRHYLAYWRRDVSPEHNPHRLPRRAAGPCLLIESADYPGHPRLADVLRHPAVREVGHAEHGRYDPPPAPRAE